MHLILVKFLSWAVLLLWINISRLLFLEIFQSTKRKVTYFWKTKPNLCFNYDLGLLDSFYSSKKNCGILVVLLFLYLKIFCHLFITTQQVFPIMLQKATIVKNERIINSPRSVMQQWNSHPSIFLLHCPNCCITFQEDIKDQRVVFVVFWLSLNIEDNSEFISWSSGQWQENWQKILHYY